MGMQPPQVVVNGVLNSLLKALFCWGSLTRVIVAAKIGSILARANILGLEIRLGPYRRCNKFSPLPLHTVFA
ncbi:hypothetical protein Tco_1149005 [Tanacetum coccineum]